ncbi:MAG: AAA family ATPase [Desulfobacterales bacterium]
MSEADRRGHQSRPTIIAVFGKTTLSAMVTKVLMEESHQRILAIDADPAVGLATSLGLTVTKTIDDIRNALVGDVQSGHKSDPQEVLRRLDYDVLEALVEYRNLAFLAVGRPEQEGCYCQVNQLLKEIIGGLSQHFDYVVIDGEAGIEQINRRVMRAVTHLLLVSDSSLKGLQVCRTIKTVAASAMAYRREGLILNRVRAKDGAIGPGRTSDLSLMGTVPESEQVRRADMAGQSILSLPEGEALQALRCCLANLLADVSESIRHPRREKPPPTL